MRKDLFLLMLVVLLSLVTYYVAMDWVVRVEVTPEEFRDHRSYLKSYRFETYGEIEYKKNVNSDWDNYDYKHTMRSAGQTYTLYAKEQMGNGYYVIHGKYDQLGTDQGSIEVSNYWAYSVPPKYDRTFQEQVDLIIYEWIVIVAIIFCTILTLITAGMKSVKKPKRYAGRLLYACESDDEGDAHSYLENEFSRLREDSDYFPSYHIKDRQSPIDKMVLTLEDEEVQIGFGVTRTEKKLVSKSEKKLHKEMDDKFDSMFESLEL